MYIANIYVNVTIDESLNRLILILLGYSEFFTVAKAWSSQQGCNYVFISSEWEWSNVMGSNVMNIPVQSVPSPTYPRRQWHVYDPSVLKQSASEGWQWYWLSAHSSTSTTVTTIKRSLETWRFSRLDNVPWMHRTQLILYQIFFLVFVFRLEQAGYRGNSLNTNEFTETSLVWFWF